ncbi:MAG TPA: hypothetical protein PKW66_19625 [Polyangiaceae bacterium]|nr:hypothetical protein [Polyangiaceae bacterium]
MKMNHAGIGLIAGLGLALLFVGCSDDEESVDGTQNPAGGGGSGGTAVDASAEGAAPTLVSPEPGVSQRATAVGPRVVSQIAASQRPATVERGALRRRISSRATA